MKDIKSILINYSNLIQSILDSCKGLDDSTRKLLIEDYMAIKDYL